MKNIARFLSTLLLSFLLFSIHSCKEEEPELIIKDKVSGLVQKGPYVNGTSITMFELNPLLKQTGKVFSTQITDNKGSFELSDVALSSRYVEFSANGFYYDEVKGEISAASLNLFALSDVKDITTVNVNLLTHLEKRRVEYLIENGDSFSEAKDKAQREILAIFDFEKTDMQNSETLDISVNNDDNALLLAISVILQGNRSVGDLTELLAGISTDIFQDGTLDDDKIMPALRSSTLLLDLQSIRQNLQTRYQSLGIDASIPNFEKYIAEFLVLTAAKPTSEMAPATDITTSGTSLNAIVNPNSSSTIVTFEYGLTTAYGSTMVADQSPLTGNIEVKVSVSISGLSPRTEYHYRVKAENEFGISYGEDVTFTTNSTGLTGTMTDADGNTYQTIGIGQQIWMAENLKTTKYNDGTDIPYISSTTSPGYSWYDDSDTYKNTTGALYNWYAVNTGKLCPAGWHVPSDGEWSTLIAFIAADGHEGNEGTALKSTTGWREGYNGTDDYGFSAIPSGRNNYGDSGFETIDVECELWSSTQFSEEEAHIRRLSSYNTGNQQYPKSIGLAIRCLKD
jgi:uncharacterized protein (TIGR02145 family)